MPESVPQIPKAFFNNIGEMTLGEIAYVVASSYLGDDIPPGELKSIVDYAFAFETPIVRISDDVYILELFHGPTLTVKDYGARFMARLIRFLDTRKGAVCRNVLVATTGNTGAAAASGLYRIEGVNVSVLYPRGVLSREQTAQFTAMGENIHPIEVGGTVEDCKRLVQQAIGDSSLANLNLTGANSINVARLLPQIAFSMYAYGRLVNMGVKDADKAIYSMPCGNCSNLVAAVMARHMGLPAGLLVAAANANNQIAPLMADSSVAVTCNGAVSPSRDVVPPMHTLARAMDMSYPSGWPRMLSLFNGDLAALGREVCAAAPVDDDTIAATINGLRATNGYTIDPQGAVALAAARSCMRPGIPTVVFATGHPAKQMELMTRITGARIELPPHFARGMNPRRHSAIIPPTLPALRKHLSSLNN